MAITDRCQASIMTPANAYLPSGLPPSLNYSSKKSEAVTYQSTKSLAVVVKSSWIFRYRSVVSMLLWPRRILSWPIGIHVWRPNLANGL
jgi:hypothetical protein